MMQYSFILFSMRYDAIWVKNEVYKQSHINFIWAIQQTFDDLIFNNLNEYKKKKDDLNAKL